MSLPSGLNFNIPETADSLTRVFEKQIRPDSGTSFTETELIRFTIPKGKYGSVIDPEGTYLSFKVKLTSTGGTAGTLENIAHLSGGAPSVIKRMNVFAGSTQIEQVREYALIHHMTAANTQPMDGGYHNHVLGGRFYSAVGTIAADTSLAAGLDADATSDLETPFTALYQMKNPTLYGGTPFIVNADTDENETMIMPLMSGVLGTTARKHFPVSLTANGLALEIVLGSNAEVLNFVGSNSSGARTANGMTGFGFEISDVRLTLKYLEIPPEIFSQLAPDGTVSLNTEMYTTLNTADLAANLNQATVIIPARYRSLKTLITVMRSSACFGYQANTFDFTHAGIGTWQYALGSELYPLTPCEGLVNSYRQLLSAYDMEDFDAENQITPESWGRKGTGTASITHTATTLTTATPQGRFVMAVSMEKFRAKSGLMFNGTSSIAENIMLHLNFKGTSLPSGTVHKLSHVVHYDAIITIGGGEASVSF